MNREIVITKCRLDKVSAGVLALKKQQLHLLGESYPASSGWKERIIGKRITLRDYCLLVELGLDLQKKSNMDYINTIYRMLPTITPSVDFSDLMIPLTVVRLNLARTNAGGYTKAQILLIGGTYPPVKGWKREIKGKLISMDAYLQFFLAGGNSDQSSTIELQALMLV